MRASSAQTSESRSSRSRATYGCLIARVVDVPASSARSTWHVAQSLFWSLSYRRGAGALLRRRATETSLSVATRCRRWRHRWRLLRRRRYRKTRGCEGGARVSGGASATTPATAAGALLKVAYPASKGLRRASVHARGVLEMLLVLAAALAV